MKKLILIVIGVLIVFIVIWMGKHNQSNHNQVNQNQTKHKETWFCPMHPQYTSDRQGLCPICNMSLVKRKDESHQDKGDVKEKKTDSHAQVKLGLSQQQLIGVRTIKAENRPLIKTIRTYGYVSTVSELYQTQNEFIDAYVNYVNVFRDYRRIQIRRQTWSTHRDLQTRVLEAKDKLLKLGLSDYEIMELQKVSWNNVWDQPKLQLFNESRNYWVVAKIFEQDLGFIDVGQEAQVHINSFNEDVKGIVRSVGKLVDPTTRTVNVLVELLNYRGDLIYNMSVNIKFSVELSTGLLIPKEALMDTGLRKIVFVMTNHGVFEPRDVQVGWEADTDVHVVSGVKEGEEVVINGNFLLDSESRLQAALGGHSHGQ